MEIEVEKLQKICRGRELKRSERITPKDEGS